MKIGFRNVGGTSGAESVTADPYGGPRSYS